MKIKGCSHESMSHFSDSGLSFVLSSLFNSTSPVMTCRITPVFRALGVSKVASHGSQIRKISTQEKFVEGIFTQNKLT